MTIANKINVVFFLFDDSRCLNFMCRRFGTLCCTFISGVNRHLPAYTAYEGGTQCSETSAHKIHTPRKSPKRKNNK